MLSSHFNSVNGWNLGDFGAFAVAKVLDTWLDIHKGAGIDFFVKMKQTSMPSSFGSDGTNSEKRLLMFKACFALENPDAIRCKKCFDLKRRIEFQCCNGPHFQMHSVECLSTDICRAKIVSCSACNKPSGLGGTKRELAAPASFSKSAVKTKKLKSAKSEEKAQICQE